MRTNKDIKFPYYSGNIFHTKVLGHVTLDEFIQVHKFPTNKTEILLKKVHQASIVGDLERKRELKQQLFSFTPGVMIEIGDKRKYDNVKKFTGLMQIDFDNIDDPMDAIAIKKHVFENYPQIICSYISPSGKGVKCLMKIIEPRDADHYRALHKGMENTFHEYSYLDLATKNAVLPLFISMDHKIMYRNWEDVPAWDYEDWTKVQHVHHNDNYAQTNFVSNDSAYGSSYNKTIRGVQRRLRSIVDEGHPQVRTAALILGSRIAAGYMEREEAESLIVSEIRNNNYLNKGIDGYIKTAIWAIGQGMHTPKYY